MPPTHPRTDGPLYCPYSAYCCAWPSYRYFSAFQVPLVSAKTSLWNWDTGCVSTCTATMGTATEWLFPKKPVGPVPPPSSSLDDSKKERGKPKQCVNELP